MVDLVLVVDVTNISQLVAFLLPVMEGISAVTTFWKDISDIVPEMPRPTPDLPGSLFSGQQSRFEITMSNIGIAIKGKDAWRFRYFSLNHILGRPPSYFSGGRAE